MASNIFQQFVNFSHSVLFLGDQPDSVDKAFTMNSPVLGSRGWRMAVHEPNTLPAIFDEGFDILPGISTSISLSSKLFPCRETIH